VSATVKLFTMLRDLSLKAANIEGS
jgi:hypothetical protein